VEASEHTVLRPWMLNEASGTPAVVPSDLEDGSCWTASLPDDDASAAARTAAALLALWARALSSWENARPRPLTAISRGRRQLPVCRVGFCAGRIGQRNAGWNEFLAVHETCLLAGASIAERPAVDVTAQNVHVPCETVRGSAPVARNARKATFPLCASREAVKS
jgi:hypothetical protein